MKQDRDRSTAGRIGIALRDRRGASAYADLDVLIPLGGTLHAVVDFKHDLVFVEVDFGDLHQVARARCRTARLGDFFPHFLVESAVGVKLERLFRARQQDLDGGVLRHQPPRELDAVLDGQLFGG